MIPAGLCRKIFQLFGLSMIFLYCYHTPTQDHTVMPKRQLITHHEVFTSENECSNNFTFEYNMNETLKGLNEDPQILPDYEHQACWSPGETCDRWQRILVVIPYRDRAKSLSISVPIIHFILQKQQKDYCLMLVEQADYNFFNKALLMNSAFLESEFFGNFNCFIFHDVDMIPENGKLNYQCQDVPLHLSPAVSKFNYRLYYGTQFGGVVAVTGNQMNHVNGFSNRFWGWGGEDNEIERRVYQSGLGREGADPTLGRYTMLEHAHSWSFDPTRKIVISVANAVFREIRLKYGYSKDDELGSKPNDWLRDGLNNVNYTILAREHRKEWLYLRTDVSMIRATNISITLNGTNRLNLVQDYETNRLTGILPCEFKKNIPGHLSKSSIVANSTTFEEAMGICTEHFECYAISNDEDENDIFYLHSESVILDRRQYSVSGSGDTVTTDITREDQIWLKDCPGQIEYLRQFTEPLVLLPLNFSIATVNFTVISESVPDTEVYFFTTIKPVVEEGVSDFLITQSKKRIIKAGFSQRIERIDRNEFKKPIVSGSLTFRLPAVAGSYEGRTVITDRDARPIGLFRWGWRQTPHEQEIEEHLTVIKKVIHKAPPYAIVPWQELDSSWMEFRHLNH